ncbi:hypothetical protein LQL77_30585 [Rhodococcus cerastii]|nr:hypothetical protein [Rhodococcus cerastii]
MNIRRTATILGTTTFGAAALLGGGIAQAAPEPAATAGDVVAVTFDKPNAPFGLLADVHTCGSAHPYLLLDDAADNSSRLARHATYRTGDGTPLAPIEFVIPTKRNAEGDYFTQAGMWVQVGGHKSITISCASTLEAAHQK